MRKLYKIFLVCLLLVSASPILAYQQDNFAIIEITASDRIINPAAIALYQDEKLYLPFDFLTQDLSLVLKYDKEAETITGWIDTESNKVIIDFKNGEGQSGKEMFNVSKDDFIYYENELYLSSKLVDEVLHSSSEFDFNGQSLKIQTIGNLPFEKELSRQQKRDQFDRITQEREKKRQEDLSKQIYTQDDFFQPPFIDLSARYSLYHTKNGGTDSNFGYSVDTSFMTGGFDSNAYLYSSSSKEPPILALKTAKIDESGKILGLFKQLEIGDIYSFGSAENLGAQNGWGFKMSTDSYLNTNGKTYNVRSELPLGWEVELYRNGEMLGYQNSSQDGFFEFTNIPLLLGKNVFKFVFYGPQGQIKEKYDTLFFNGNILDKGKTRLKLDYVNKNRYLVEFRDKPRQTSLGHQALAEFGYGITNSLTVNVSAIADSLEIPALFPPNTYYRKDKAFAAAELSLFSFGVFSSLGTIADFDKNAFTLDYYAQTSIYNWDITFENIYFGKAETNRNILGNTFIKNNTTLRLNKTLKLGFLGLFPFSYSLQHFNTMDGRNQTEHYASLSKNLPYDIYANLTYQNSYWYSQYRSEKLGFNLNKIYGPWTLRGNTLYDLTYDALQDVEVSAYRNLTPRLKMGVKYLYTARNIATRTYESLYSTNLNWQTKIGLFSLEGGISNKHNRYIFLGYNLSLLPEPRSNKIYTSATKLQGTGAIAARAFMDDNMNGVFDAEEAILQEAEFDLKPKMHTFDSKHTSKNGGMLLSHLPIYRPVDITVNIKDVQETLSLLNTVGTKTIMLRPAQVVYLDFPMVGTGDIEGSVFIQKGDTRKQARGIILKLYNAGTKELLSSKISEYDGYYLFQQLPMGEYEIVIDSDQAEELGLIQTRQIKVKLEKFEQLEIRDILLNQTEMIEEDDGEDEEDETEIHSEDNLYEEKQAVNNDVEQAKNTENTPKQEVKTKPIEKVKKVIKAKKDESSILEICINLFKEYYKKKSSPPELTDKN